LATGITAREKHSPDALTAAIPGRDPYPLPDPSAVATLTYPGRLEADQVIAPIQSSFVRPDRPETPIDLEPNAFVLCDNLVGLNAIANSPNRARLIYLDPPYNTGFDFHSRDLKHAYKDDWHTPAYIEFMRRRLILARECLADDGSIYIHIGHQMLGHLKVIMDEIFGPQNCRNIISRRKCSSKNFTSKQYANIHDYLLFYSKSKSYYWDQPTQAPSKEWLDREYPKSDQRGQYKLVPVHAPGTRNGETGLPWRGKNPPPGKHWQYAPSKLDQLDRDGFIHWSKTGNPRRKVYLSADKALPYTDNWDAFRDAHHQSIKITGYPTEKNLNMLKMIVGASSEPGDLVIDPFCGSGSTLHAASDLGRRWIGLDESFSAAEASLHRLKHGLTAMGDYVERDAANDRQPQLEGLMFQESTGGANEAREFSFVVDQEILPAFREQVDELAAI